ncbi:glucuronyl hydrolase [Flavihumibacter stibioxidans]|uniref:Glucuronyl hydrolase n=2 Tax=Flavihumibacter stibioxidans TaxID=1834163 RepID=A0ABR7M8V7_9BACT|nr:glucuronyl hydrolase [Flavihumibacter stibioxidans]
MRFHWLLAISVIVALSFSLLSWSGTIKMQLIERNFQVAEKRYDQLLLTATDKSKYPHSLNKDGSLFYYGIDEWTGGFWPGCLWFMFEFTGDAKWKKAAEEWTASLESNQFNTVHHDIGFMMFSSYGNGLRLTGNESYKPILVQSARSLCKRYSPVVGSIQSWPARRSKDGRNHWQFPVIMDNMMNLELLFWAAKETGDSSFYHIAVKHAETTRKNHVRPDHSSFHVVNYDPVSGKMLHQQTLQGFSDNSAWSRGQAWGIYGFTATYRFTKDRRFLQTAIGMADFYLDNKRLPADRIPLWDFNAGQKGYKPDWAYDPNKYNPVPRDVSAASITASALLELSEYCDGKRRKKYYDAAANMLESLSRPEYLNDTGSNPYFLLKHSVGNLPSDREVDVPLIYADYYFLEAMHRYIKMNLGRE